MTPPVTPPGQLWRAWSWEPGVIAGIVVSALWYAWGVRSLWRCAGRGRGVRRAQVACFGGGLLAIAIALISPLDAAGETIFAAHMAQHLVLILIAAPLLVLGAPLLPLLWALPRGTRRRLGRWWRGHRRVRSGIAAATAPVVVWLAQIVVLWAWHQPTLYQAALRDDAVHAAEHFTLLLTAGLFWWVVFQPTGRRRLHRAAAVLYVVLVLAPTGALGALLIFARQAWYPAHIAGAAAWHMTALEDQQLAGVIMFVPGSLVYIAIALVLTARWVLAEPEERRPRPALRQANISVPAAYPRNAPPPVDAAPHPAR